MSIQVKELLADVALPSAVWTNGVNLNLPTSRYLLIGKNQIRRETLGVLAGNTQGRSWARYNINGVASDFKLRSNYPSSLNYAPFIKMTDIVGVQSAILQAQYNQVSLAGSANGVLISSGDSAGFNSRPLGSTAYQTKMIIVPIETIGDSVSKILAPTAINLTPEVYTDVVTITLPSNGLWWVIGQAQGHRNNTGAGEVTFMQCFHLVDRGTYSHWLEDSGWDKVTNAIGGLLAGAVVTWWSSRSVQATAGERIAVSCSTAFAGGQVLSADICAIKPVTIHSAKLEVDTTDPCPFQPLLPDEWFSGPTVILTPGQWVLTGTAHFHIDNDAAKTIMGVCYADLWDGTTEYDLTAVTVDNRLFAGAHPAVLNVLGLVEVPDGQTKSVAMRARFSATLGSVVGAAEYPHVCYAERCPLISPVTQPYDLLPEDEENARFGTHLTAFQISPLIPIGQVGVIAEAMMTG